MPRTRDTEMEQFEKDLLQSIAEMKRGEFAPRTPHLVFVFGTLKEGYPNFATNRGRRIPGDFVTQERYPLYLMGERFSPWLVFQPGEGERIAGQLFEVDDAALAAMDLLERVGEADGYRRVAIGVEGIGEASAPRTVHAYVKPPEQFDPAQARLGPLTEYTMAHAGLYRPRSTAE